MIASHEFFRSVRKREYQLVLQFRDDSLADFDAMVALEESLADELGKFALVDGHDIGAGEVNIFISTSDPVATFGKIRNMLLSSDRLAALTAAFRPISGDNYTVLWPEFFQGQFAVA